MSLLDIIKEPSAALNMVSRPLEPNEINDELRVQLSNMAETMYYHEGVGLAGPQVGDFRRILVADLGYVKSLDFSDYGKNLVKMINPQILSSSQETGSSIEGCLSIPLFQQKVSRSREITVAYIDEHGQSIQTTFQDFEAVVILHEIDHLDGITLYTRAGAPAKRRYLKNLKK